MLSETAWPSHQVLALLSLPDRQSVTDAQARGADCVWHRDERVHGATAVDLGEHVTDGGEHWWPRACGKAVQQAALHALHEHAPRCERCVTDAAHCDIGLGLRRLMRAGRR